MAMYDPQRLAHFAKQHYLLNIYKTHGDRGVEIYHRMISSIQEIHQHMDLQVIPETAVLFSALDDGCVPFRRDEAIEVSSLDLLAKKVQSDRPFTIQFLASGGVLLWNNFLPDVHSLSNEAVVYTYTRTAELFHAGGRSEPFPRVWSCGTSTLAVPTFTCLREALEYYARKAARHSSCPTLEKVWHDDGRMFLANKPESKMRDSLAYFIDIHLRNVSVNREQNVDETKPVDIKVTWVLDRKAALIEIKWMGKSVDASGRVTTQYSESRARDGAKQLDDYLELHERNNTLRTTRGYLVVFDARRATHDPMQYEFIEVTYDPRYDRIRKDFEPPVRMFMEPKRQ